MLSFEKEVSMEATVVVVLLTIIRLLVPFGIVMLISSLVQRHLNYTLH